MWQIKQLAILFLIFFKSSVGAEVCGTEQGDQIICELLTSLRDIIKNGSPEIGIPPLDPLEIADLPLNLTNDALSVNLRMQNLSVHELSLFEVTETVLGIFSPTVIGMDFHSIQLKTAYDGHLKIMNMINLYGKGDILLKILNLSFKLQFQLQLVKIKIVEAKVILNSPPVIEAKFTGLFNDEFMSNIISRQFSDTATTLLKEKLNDLNDLLANVVQGLVDQYINPLLGNRIVDIDNNTKDENEKMVTDVLKQLVQHLKTKPVV